MKWTSRREERRREKQIEFEEECEARDTENRRKAALSLWARIDELEASQELKDILHLLANGAREE